MCLLFQKRVLLGQTYGCGRRSSKDLQYIVHLWLSAFAIDCEEATTDLSDGNRNSFTAPTTTKLPLQSPNLPATMSEESDERETKPFKFVTAGMLHLKAAHALRLLPQIIESLLIRAV